MTTCATRPRATVLCRAPSRARHAFRRRSRAWRCRRRRSRKGGRQPSESRMIFRHPDANRRRHRDATNIPSVRGAVYRLLGHSATRRLGDSASRLTIPHDRFRPTALNLPMKNYRPVRSRLRDRREHGARRRRLYGVESGPVRRGGHGRTTRFLHLLDRFARTPQTDVVIPVDGGQLAIHKAAGFRAVARSGTGVQGAPAGLAMTGLSIDLRRAP